MNKVIIHEQNCDEKKKIKKESGMCGTKRERYAILWLKSVKLKYVKEQRQ
ncbi:MAG: hypothetical protein MSA26_05705 [Lachnospiraceae bacterium]|nr:hypothetical protein [Lachnospiraceae bacterium]